MRLLGSAQIQLQAPRMVLQASWNVDALPMPVQAVDLGFSSMDLNPCLHTAGWLFPEQ